MYTTIRSSASLFRFVSVDIFLHRASNYTLWQFYNAALSKLYRKEFF